MLKQKQNPLILDCNNCINSNIYDVANAAAIAAIAAAKYPSPPPPDFVLDC